VHINYSPVILYKGFITEYDKLFKEVKDVAGENKCEVIFLTNHKFQMAKAPVEAQEMMGMSNQVKNASGVMRYELGLKSKGIGHFKDTYAKYFELETIRYIF